MKFKYGYETAVVLVALLLTGLFCSRFLISAGTIGLSALWLVLPGKRSLVSRWRSNPLAVSAGLIWFVYILSGINSQDTLAYLDVMKKMLPYLFIPISLLGIPVFSPSVNKGLTGFFLLLLLVSGAGSLSYYVEHRDAVAEAYTRGQILPTVIHHVSYSVLVVLGILAGTEKALDTFLEKKYARAGLYALPVLFCIVLLHILATRTGLFLFYGILPVYLVARAWKAKAYAWIGLGVLILVVIGVVGYHTSGTLQAKLNYMRYDLQHIRENKNTDNQLSDSRRWLSNKLGWALFCKYPLTGAGIGDVRAEMEKLYEERFPDYQVETRGHVHNQYLYVLAGGGILAGSLFLLAMGFPVYYHFRRGDPLMGCICLALALVLFWEPFLAYQYGNTISLLVLIAGLQKRQEL